jgi:uncharacterized protein (DUF58 family)
MKIKINIDAPLIDADDFNDLSNQARQIKPTGGYAHRLESHFSGTLPTKKIGSGMDYAESRVYQAGDDPRFINWRLTARSNETLVKSFHTESSPTLCILMDRGTTMRFGTRKRLKITQAARVATLLSVISQQHRLALSGLVLDDSETNSTNQWFPSSKNDQAFNSWIDNVTGACLPSFSNTLANQSKESQSKNWQLTLRNLADKNPLGSLIYLVSDFSGLSAENQSTLEALQSQHYVIAIHISDPAEHELSNNGTLRFKDGQTHELYQVKSASHKQREQFQSRSQTYQESIKNLFEDRGIPFISISTIDDDLASLIPLPLEAI